METTQNSIGTSLEVLAPYLPYGIDVELLKPRTYRARLVGLGQPRGWKCLYLDGHDPALPLADCLPVLRPFSQLCDPLPDGTIPAEILAGVVKQSSRYMELFLRSGIVIKQRGGEGPDEPARVEIWGEHTATAVFTIFSDFTFYTALQTDYAAIIDTLRRLQFALPVNGRPLVEGVDFIPAAPLAPTQEGAPPLAG